MLACFWLGLLATGLVLLARLWPAPPLMLVHAAAAVAATRTATAARTTTAAAAAVEWGFWHFGEFSRAY
jgi:hypothetical protein